MFYWTFLISQVLTFLSLSRILRPTLSPAYGFILCLQFPEGQKGFAFPIPGWKHYGTVQKLVDGRQEIAPFHGLIGDVVKFLRSRRLNRCEVMRKVVSIKLVEVEPEVVQLIYRYNISFCYQVNYDHSKVQNYKTQSIIYL